MCISLTQGETRIASGEQQVEDMNGRTARGDDR